MAELTLKSPGIEFFETDFAPAAAIKLVNPTAIVINSTWGPVHKLTYCANKKELFRKFGLATTLSCGRYLALAESYLDYADGIYVVRALPQEGSFSKIAVGTSTSTVPVGINFTTSMGSDPTSAIAEMVDIFFTAKYPGTMGNALTAIVYSQKGVYDLIVSQTVSDAIAGNVLNQIIANLGITPNALLNMFGFSSTNQSSWRNQKWLMVVVDNGKFPSASDSYPNFNSTLNVREYAFIDPQFSNITSGAYPTYQTYVNSNFTLISAARGTVNAPGPLGAYSDVTGRWDSPYLKFVMKSATDINDSDDAMTEAIGNAQKYLSTDSSLFETIIAPIYDTFESSSSITLPPQEEVQDGMSRSLLAVAKSLAVSIENKKTVTLFTIPKNSLNTTEGVNAVIEGLVGPSGALLEYSKYTYAFADTGWVEYTTKYANALNGLTYQIPMSGMTAGLISYNKINYNIWSASAGYIRGVYKAGVKLLTPQPKSYRDLLYPFAINCVIEDGDKVLLFGNKTFCPDLPGNLSRIEVRLLMLRIQKTVEDYAKTFLFESNDASTRSRFKYLVDQYLSSLKVSSGIQDYYIRLDESNNTPSIIDTNRLIVSIAIKPQKSINYITINYNIVNSSMSVQEV